MLRETKRAGFVSLSITIGVWTCHVKTGRRADKIRRGLLGRGRAGEVLYRGAAAWFSEKILRDVVRIRGLIRMPPSERGRRDGASNGAGRVWEGALAPR